MSDTLKDSFGHGRTQVAGKVVLISTYELGRQPFGLASPAAYLKAAGAEVNTLDLAVHGLDEGLIRSADMIGFHLPMHTATRLAVTFAQQVRQLNPTAHLAFFGLYATPNAELLTQLGGQTILSGEFEPGLVAAYRNHMCHQDGFPFVETNTARMDFVLPERGHLPTLEHYAHLMDTQGRTRLVGYTEASRGCKHHCRHCPVVPVYGGKFRIVPQEIVLQDIEQQASAGAQHITFGDPDFFNGIGHALPLIEELHQRFPDLTYDVTIKVEHLVQYNHHLEALRRTGCLLITTAIESFDDATLKNLDKGHSPQDLETALAATRRAGLHLNPTFVAFHPWMTLSDYMDFLDAIERYDLIDHVAPIQLAIRLLIPPGSGLLERDDIQNIVQPFNPEALAYPWAHPDPRVDELQTRISALVEDHSTHDVSRTDVYLQVRQMAGEFTGLPVTSSKAPANPLVSKPIPYLTENWYC